MALPILLLLLVSSFSIIPSSHSALTGNYYAKTCPNFEKTLREIIQARQKQTPTTGAAVLRLFFNDCAVDGCDASVLIKSTAFKKAEVDDGDLNEFLAGEGFEVIQRVKTALELECPDTVSCADILTVATRDLVKQLGGPFYSVRLGRRDGTVSEATNVAGKIPRANSTVDQMIKIFQAQGFTIPEMVVLIGGGHTIGFAHCKEFADRIFGPSLDPTMNPKLAAGLRQLCADYKKNTSMAAYLDPMTPETLDNSFFKNLQKGLGVLASDQMLMSDPRTRPFVEKYAKDAAAFAKDFGNAMEKMSVHQVKTGKQGEIRKRCDLPNNS